MRNFQKHILFLGNRNDVPRLYQAMDVFVLPSRYEGLPVVGVEAQAAGLPCLLSDMMTAETKLTQNAVFMSIHLGAEAWAKSVVAYCDVERKQEDSLRMNSLFNIREQAERLANFYLSSYFSCSNT